MDLSIVIPVFNEQKNLEILHEQLANVLKKLKKSYEVLFVDDGSSDNSFETLKKIRLKDNKVKIIKFRRNFGQSAAMNAGFSRSQGKVIITMDADLQNDPKDIPKLLGELNKDYDVISGWRKKRRDPIGKKIFSRFANRLYKKLTGVKIHDSGCSLKAYKKEAIKGLELYGEMHRFLPALVAAKGFKIGEVEIKHHPRKYGKTKYGTSRLVHGFLDLMYVNFWTRYSTRPLHYFGGLGIAAIVIGLIVGLYKSISLAIKILYLKQVVYVGPLLLFSIFLIIVGLLFILFGFLAEIKIRLYYGQSEKTVYEIEQVLK